MWLHAERLNGVGAAKNATWEKQVSLNRKRLLFVIPYHSVLRESRSAGVETHTQRSSERAGHLWRKTSAADSEPRACARCLVQQVAVREVSACGGQSPAGTLMRGKKHDFILPFQVSLYDKPPVLYMLQSWHFVWYLTFIQLSFSVSFYALIPLWWTI